MINIKDKNNEYLSHQLNNSIGLLNLINDPITLALLIQKWRIHTIVKLNNITFRIIRTIYRINIQWSEVKYLMIKYQCKLIAINMIHNNFITLNDHL
jgi:hypothetical protein